MVTKALQKTVLEKRSPNLKKDPAKYNDMWKLYCEIVTTG